MNWTLEAKKIDDLFIVRSGDFHATKELDPGTVPLISCGDTENGLVGHFDIPKEKRYRHCITVAYNGQPLLAKFHPYEFGAKDDIAVLKPRHTMLDTTLLYIAVQLNAAKWRYSYGRKCFRKKLLEVPIQIPVKKWSTNNKSEIDQENIAVQFPIDFQQLIPRERRRDGCPPAIHTWQSFAICDLFNVKRGDFHSLAVLDHGKYRTVSRVTQDNGTVGYFNVPEKAKIYPRGRITISTVSGDAFVQLSVFIATDNVLILAPKSPMELTTLFFVASALNRQKWRYSYGRQCYKEKFETATQIWLPITEDGNLDEVSIKTFLENTAYWTAIKEEFDKTS